MSRLDLGRHRGHERRGWVVELDPLDRRLQALRRMRDEGAVEGAGHVQLDGAPRALVDGLVTALLDRRVLTRDDDLTGAVVVGGPDPNDLPAELFDDRIVEPEDGRHRTGALPSGFRHREPTLTDKRQRLFGRKGIRGRERCELADRVPDHVVRLDPARLQRSENRQAGRNERRLLDRGVEELVDMPLETETLQIEARSVATNAEDLHRVRERLRDLTAHAGFEGPLPRKTERDLAHHFLPFVHSIKPEPHVRPAPMPVMSTSAPSRKRPSACASASASGIEPEDVLPYRSTLTTIFSFGIPSFSAAWSMIRTFAWWGM